jgi:hypothetical protein
MIFGLKKIQNVCKITPKSIIDRLWIIITAIGDSLNNKRAFSCGPTHQITNYLSNMMFKPSLLLLVCAAIIVQTFAAASVQIRSNIPDLISSTGESAQDAEQCEEQFVLNHS